MKCSFSPCVSNDQFHEKAIMLREETDLVLTSMTCITLMYIRVSETEVWFEYKLFNYLIILFHCFKENCPDGDSDPSGAGPWPRGPA